MFATADCWMMRQLAFASVVLTLTMSGPVILVSISTHLPSQAIYSNLLLPSLASVVPMILYRTLPVLVAIAIVHRYGAFSSNGTIVALHMAGRSVAAVRWPAIWTATIAAVVGYAMSTTIAPLTAGHLHDSLYAVRHKTDPSLLNVGELNSLNSKGDAIYFRRRLSRSVFETVFVIKKGEDHKDLVYTAQSAIYGSDGSQNYVVLLSGSVLSGNRQATEVIKFERLRLPLTPSASAARRYRLLDELDLPQFIASRSSASLDVEQSRSWLREAANRFVVPGLVLIHTLLGLELLASVGLMNDRKRQPVWAISAILAALHFAEVVALEQVNAGVHLIWVFVALVAVELGAILVLLAHRSLDLWRMRLQVPGPIERGWTLVQHRLRGEGR